MLIISTSKCSENNAGDGSFLRELMNKNTIKNLDLNVSLARAKVLPGGQTKRHILHGIREIYYILQGKGEIHINEEVAEISEGDAVLIPSGSVQYIKNLSNDVELDFICVADPAFTVRQEEIL